MAEDRSSICSQSLTDAWKRFCDRFPPDKLGDEQAQVLCERLQIFHHEHSVEDVPRIIGCLSRGKHLIRAALRWHMPVIGPETATPTDQVRGHQWRVVMAWGGLEILVKGLLLAKQSQGLGASALHQMVTLCKLTQYESWKLPAVALGGRELKGDGKCISQLKHRLAGNPIGTWFDALQMAQAIRHLTAHGVLSASRANRCKLSAAFPRLTNDIGNAATAILAHLS